MVLVAGVRALALLLIFREFNFRRPGNEASETNAVCRTPGTVRGRVRRRDSLSAKNIARSRVLAASCRRIRIAQISRQFWLRLLTCQLAFVPAHTCRADSGSCVRDYLFSGKGAAASLRLPPEDDNRPTAAVRRGAASTAGSTVNGHSVSHVGRRVIGQSAKT
jgi:hypothetical protein